MLYFFVLLILVAADQASKYYIVHNFELLKSVSIINNLIYLTYIKNMGAAFGILQNYQFLFIIATITILCIVLVYFFNSPEESILLRTSLIFILAGGIGNLIDRVRLGYVIDFIDVRVWPVFNVADSLVVVGSILLIYYIIFKYR